MADAPLKPARGRRKLKIAGLGLGLALISTAAYATYPVIDAEAIARMREQLGKLQEQIDTLNEHTRMFGEMSRQLQDQIDAIGALGKVSIPMVNLDRLRQDVMRNVQCLKPDLESLMPGVDLDELDFGSICQGKIAYQKTLWVDPDELADPKNWEQQKAVQAEVQGRREALAKEAAASGLAQGELAATEQAETNQRAADELEAAAQAATNQNERLAVLTKAEVLKNRQLVQMNQLMAQLVKIQALTLIGMSQPVNGHPISPEDAAISDAE